MTRVYLIQDRTPLINQLHAYVCELGYKAPKVRGPLRLYVYDLCDPSHPDLSHVIKAELALMLEEFAQKDKRVKDLDKTLMQTLCERAHPNIAIVAMANKLARISWAIIVHDRDYDPNFISLPPVHPKKGSHEEKQSSIN